MTKRIHIIGRKNHGKTTLVVELVEALIKRGLRVGTVKHTHHHHELDTPGKDSHRHREAGASVVGICSPAMNAVFWPRDASENGEAKYDEFVAMASCCDLILVEGDTQTTATKLEVWRSEVGTEPIAAKDATISAVISDDQPPCETQVWSRSNLDELCEQLLMLARPTEG